MINKVRKENGLEPIKNVLQETVLTNFLNLIPYSKHLYPKKIYREKSYQICGYLKSTNHYHHWIPPENFVKFMEGDEMPVFITVGSMEEHETDLQGFQKILIETANLISRKTIILSSWKQGNTIEGKVYKLTGFVSYPEVLIKCSLVVHHGGIGIMHHATEAGCPSVIIKYGHDQPYNAKLLFDLGISNGSILRKELNSAKLAGLITDALENKEMKHKAAQLALLLKNENGVENAVEIIEHKAAHHKIINLIPQI
jgi:UDP:flavonoid glycosyltransferase YjiC (YdhE family)